MEFADDWLQAPCPWLVMRTEYATEVKLYGHVETHLDDRGDFCANWVAGNTVLGIPHDLPICGYGGTTVNFLRLWESRATTEFDLRVFNEGRRSPRSCIPTTRPRAARSSGWSSSTSS